jgi:hypothetical protein
MIKWHLVVMNLSKMTGPFSQRNRAAGTGANQPPLSSAFLKAASESQSSCLLRMWKLPSLLLVYTVWPREPEDLSHWPGLCPPTGRELTHPPSSLPSPAIFPASHPDLGPQAAQGLQSSIPGFGICCH